MSDSSGKGVLIFMGAVALMIASQLYFGGNTQPRTVRTGQQRDEDSSDESSSDSDPFMSRNNDSWQSDSDSEETEESDNEEIGERPVPKQVEKQESVEERRERMVSEGMERDRQMQEIERNRQDIERREREWQSKQPTTSINEWNKQEKHKVDIKDARIINKEDQDIQKGTIEKVKKIEETFETLASPGKQRGQNRPELTDQVIDDTLKGMHKDVREMREELEDHLKELENTGESIPDMDEEQLENVIHRKGDTPKDK